MLLLHMLLHVRSTYVARIHFDFHLEWMQRTERNQIVRVWTVYYLYSFEARASESIFTANLAFVYYKYSV